jgi:serine/threonine protein kinase
MLEFDATGALLVKVIDFGVAKVLASEAERVAEQTQTSFIGTPAFASPEQFASIGQTRIDTRSDIYSLGVTFWYLLSGRLPFVGRTLADIRARQAEVIPVEQLKDLHIPTGCLALLKSMLAPDPKDRPQSARELRSAVHRCSAKFSADAFVTSSLDAAIVRAHSCAQRSGFFAAFQRAEKWARRLSRWRRPRCWRNFSTRNCVAEAPLLIHAFSATSLGLKDRRRNLQISEMSFFENLRKKR